MDMSKSDYIRYTKERQKELLKAVKAREQLNDDNIKIKTVIEALDIQKHYREDMSLQEILKFKDDWTQLTREVKDKLEKGYVKEK